MKYKKRTNKYKCFREYGKNKLADRQCDKNSKNEADTNLFCYQGCLYYHLDYI